MILPIVAYGHPTLRQETREIDQDFPNLEKILADMYETMYGAKGVGLAAPQVDLPIRVFIVDASPFAEDEEEDEEMMALKDFKRTFINPIILEETGDKWAFEEGCLSIPSVREEVMRKDRVLIEYYDENFDLYEEEFVGIAARIVQHEYDHIEGVLFTDHLNPLKRRLLKKKLNEISKGNTDVKYKMKFPKK